MLGSVSLERDGQPVVGRASQRRRLALLALLAVARERGVPRDRLLALLWPERDADSARHTLSQTLYAIRRDLGEDAIVAGGDDLRLDASVVSSDVADFETAIAAGDHERAVALYGGPFLDAFFVSDAPEFERWVDSERQRIQTAYGAALVALADAATARHDLAAAAACWRRRAALEPLSGSVTVKLMTALAAGGDRASAIRQARIHAELLRADMNVGPDPAVASLAERLAREPISVPAAEPAPAIAPVSVPAIAVRRAPGHRAWLTLGIVIVALAGIASVVRSGPGLLDPPPPTRAVVLGSIMGTDASLGLAVREALRAELEAEGGVRVLGEGQIRETLELMRRGADAEIETPLALEIGVRRGVPLVITGSAVPIGTGAQLVARLLDARSGETIATLSERPERAEDVVPAVASLAAALRRHAIGAPAADAPPPLPPVTTASLPALRNYAQARQALARLDRDAAMALLEAAIAHDSLFALAHYLAGDVAWYIDEYSHSVSHLTTALRLAPRLPPRERLIVRARYEQLVRDRPDSALVYWQQLRLAYPDDPLGPEGVIWTYIAMDRKADIAAVAETALALAPSPDMVRFRHSALVELGDTTEALRVARGHKTTNPQAEFSVRLAILERRHAWSDALRLLDSAYPAVGGRPNPAGAASRQLLLLNLGRLDEARREMDVIVERNWMQAAPRALLFQAHAEIGQARPPAGSRALVQRALRWVERADIYPPALSRLTELVAIAAARVGDTLTLARARDLVRAKDGGRGLPSYRATLLTIDACTAFARADWRRAANLLEETRPFAFHGRAREPLMLLEADARAALGQRERADSLSRAVSQTASIWQPLAAR